MMATRGRLCANKRCDWADPESVGAQCGWDGDECPECGCTDAVANLETLPDTSDLEAFE